MKLKLVTTIIYCLLWQLPFAQKIATGISAIASCKVAAPFTKKFLANPNLGAFSTAEKKWNGVVLLDLSNQKAPKVYQDSTWKSFGNMGPMAIDNLGNVYVAPIPMVNVLSNKREDQNKIYKIDCNTGIMSLFLDLGTNQNQNNNNPFGIVGLFYDCAKGNLYVSSIYDSNQEQEKGIIYCVNISTKNIVDKILNTDAMGLAVVNFNNKPTLFYGHSRNQKIYYTYLNANGSFNKTKNVAFSLQNLGPRGDDIAKKIRCSTKNELIINTTVFYYNLTAPSDIQETTYSYKFDLPTQKFVKTAEEHKGLVVGFE